MNSFTNNNNSETQSEFVEDLNVFRQIEFFSGFPIDVLKLFAFLCKRQSYKTGDVIFQQNNDDSCSYYILQGKAKLVFKNQNKDFFIREYGAENYFGVLSLMTPMVKQFSLIAVEDTTCLVMNRDSFSKVVDQFPDIPVKIVKSIGERVLQAEKKCIAEFENEGKEELKQLLGVSLI
jgi:CRP/FNR family transcriptional regulator, cyclic AMP receptor protein